jgi:hypothetical protein
MAEVAFPYHPPLGVILRNPVGAIPGAVSTADTSVRIVENDAGFETFRVGINRAPLQTRGYEAVITPHGEVEPLGERIGAGLDLADTPPIDFKGVTILLRTGHLTAPAADAAGHVEMKTVLLPRRRRRNGGRQPANGITPLRPLEEQ